MGRKVLLGLLLTAALIGIIIGCLALYGNYQMCKIPALSAKEALDYSLSGETEGVITIGTVRDGVRDYHVYGRDGRELPRELRTYEIGSLTKTFTSSLVCKAVQENRISLDAPIDTYLELPEKEHYPTVEELLTHISGYKGYYLKKPMISNFFAGRNDFYGISDPMILDSLAGTDIQKGAHSFVYSNFGYAALGLILEAVYETEYENLVNDYLAGELGLSSTHISDGNFPNAWDWQSGDAYMAAGALTSDIEDMLSYADLYLNRSICGGTPLDALKTVNATPARYEKMGIRMDAIGYGWILDRERGFIWHNGGTGNYNCYLGLDMENGNAVVVLSDLPPGYRIPATVVGVKMLEEMRKE